MVPEFLSADFWIYLGSIATVLIAVQALVRPFLDSIPSKTEKILVNALAEQFQQWVTVRSKSQKFDVANLRVWLLEQDGVWALGRSYRVFKKMVKNLKRKGYSEIRVIDEVDFDEIIKQVDSAHRWARSEW